MKNNDNFFKFVKMAEQLKEQGEVIQQQGLMMYESVKYMEEMAREVGQTAYKVEQSEKNIMKVGDFMIDFYNEYRQHDALTSAQAKELKEAQNKVTTAITTYLFPDIPVNRGKGSPYLKEWIKVNRGLWSIFKRNVNGVNIPYDRTPKIKFEQALEYMKSLTVGDYLAYSSGHFDAIKRFNFDEALIKKKVTLEDIVKSTDSDTLLLEGETK